VKNPMTKQREKCTRAFFHSWIFFLDRSNDPMLRNRAKRSLFLYLLLQLGIAGLERDEMGKERRTAKEGRLKKINWVGGGGDSKGAGWK
jgi:hypothetical protein